ncbi:GNAT family N-acetyltransferase [Fundicoccus sp. Sow4_D5]|uniref:GNAT family N-acetyltransferase n=1 Tax=unclassified Fundicoccus TaxID=2761543 RepID=UPI003F911C37
MKIRHTVKEDIERILEIFEHGRQVQLKTGNPNQWRKGHPGRELVMKDLMAGFSYVCVVDEKDQTDLPVGTIVATFAALEGEDPTYTTVEGGQWLNDAPYVTIHRISTSGQLKGTGQHCMQWVIDHYNNIKIDTHHLNQPMIHVIEKFGFKYCGVIYVGDGTARNAYHYTRLN